MGLVAVVCALACRPGGESEPADAPTQVAATPTPTAPAQDAAAPPTAADGNRALASAAETPAVAEAMEPEPEPEPETPTVPETPYKVLIVGDSLAATGFGALLERRLDAHPHVVCYRKGKSASGLARPDFFDWLAEGKRQVEAREPDLIIAIMGGNDGQDLTKVRGSKRVSWQSEDWGPAYRARMDAFLSTVAGDGRKVLWLGLPHMGLRSLEKKLVTIRQVQKQAVEALGANATYVDTVPYTTDEAGATLATAKVGKRGKEQTLRADDKIHFTMSGSEYFADRIYPDVLRALSLPDVDPETPKQ